MFQLGRRQRAVAVIAGTLLAVAFGQVSANATAPSGRILFNHSDPSSGSRLVYTMRPDGTDKHLLIAGPLDFPHWSPDGRLVVGLASGPNGEEDRAATIVDVQTGTVRQLVMPDPTLFTACPVWSADAARLFCEGLGESDRTGIWSIRSSDGGDLSQLTSNTDDDFPAEASPDGRHLLFTRVSGESVGTFIVNVDGTGLRQLVPDELIVNFENGGSWSPDSRVILFEARATPDSRFSIWSIRADGTGLHEVIGPPLCGGLVSDQKSAGCHGPEWSPDGTRFVFSRRKNPLAPSLDDIYVAHANGSGLQRLTTSPDDDAFPDWGVAPWTDQNRRPLSRGG